MAASFRYPQTNLTFGNELDRLKLNDNTVVIFTSDHGDLMGDHGANMMPIVRQENAHWRNRYFYEHTYQTEPPRSPIPRSEGIRGQRWKYIRYPDVDEHF